MESGSLATSLDYFCMYICLAVVDAQKVAWDGYEPRSAEKLQRKHIGKQRVHTHACTHHSQRPSLRGWTVVSDNFRASSEHQQEEKQGGCERIAGPR